MTSVRLLVHGIQKTGPRLLLVLAMADVLAPAITDRSGLEAAACKDVPLRVTLYNSAVIDPATGATVPTAIQSDGLGDYVNGTAGLVSIRTCDGTNDAVVNIASTKRNFAFTFPTPIAGSVIDAVPSWVPGRSLVNGWINVRNITYSKQPFTTRMGSTFTKSGDRATYRLGFMPPDADAPDLHTGSLDASLDNTPYPSSPATVYPSYPAICGAGSTPTWLVRGTSTNSVGQLQVAALHTMPNRGPQVHQGQYSMPFEMRIEALQCFPY